MDSSVLLSTDELRVRRVSKEPLDLAVLSGSMLAILGDGTTVAPDLALVLSGRRPPATGRVLLGESGMEPGSGETRGMVEYVPGAPVFPAGVTVFRHLYIAAAAAGHRRKDTGDILQQLMVWCSLEKHSESPVAELPPDIRYRTAFAAACLPVPRVLVLQGPFPVDLHPLLEDICQGGASVIACIPGLEHMPQRTDRIALCDGTDVRRIVRFGELSEACSSMMRLRVSFFPALPRAVMESLPGARDVVAVSGGYEFLHRGLSAAVTNLVNLARANSRQISGLEVRPPSNDELVDHFTAVEDTGEADLFCREDLDI